MKKITSLFILVFIFVLSGCSSKPKTIEARKIFAQDESVYYVYFYKKDCPACENTKPKLYEYIDFTKSKKGALSPRVYQVNVLSLPNLKAGENWEEEIIGISNVLDLTIGSTPTLILIEDRKVSQVNVGVNAITNELKSYME